MLALERRRLKLRWPMHVVDTRSGVQDGYYAKMLHAETASGRTAGWEVLQLVVDALYPNGCGFRFTGEPVPDDATMREKIKAAKERLPRALRQHSSATRTHLREYASATAEANP
jgi:hypothetical protein